MKPLTPAQRLIVAADFDGAPDEVLADVVNFAMKLQGTGVVLKVNSALRGNYSLITTLRDLGLSIFADLKVYDISNTLRTDGERLAFYAPDMVTVACVSGKKSISALVQAMPETEVLGVTVLTSLDSSEVEAMHGGLSLNAVVGNLAEIAVKAGVGGLICSGHEAEMLRKTHGDGITLNCPGIRPSFVQVKNEDQKRMMTPAQAIRAGATRIVVGRPITEAPDPLEAVRHIIAEIEEALATLK